MKRHLALYLVILSEDCSDNASGNHKMKDYDVGHHKIVAVLQLIKKVLVAS